VVEIKICCKCKVPKEIEQFSRDKTTKDRYDGKCKQCRREHYDNNKEDIKIKHKEHYKNNKEYFQKYLKQWNKDKKEHIENYNINNKERRTKNVKEWNKKNPEYAKQYKENYKPVSRVRERERYKTDVEWRITKILRARIRFAIKFQKTFKSKGTLILLGCTVTEFKQYLESQFKPEMNWSNHGTIWEIDHIIQCATFDLSKPEEQAKCFHYTNMRPLFKTTQIAESFGHNDHIGNQNRDKPRRK
jgi:hypothetical protein